MIRPWIVTNRSFVCVFNVIFCVLKVILQLTDGRMDRYIQGNTPPIIRLVGIIEPVSRDPKFTIIVQQFSILLNY